jgi:hypothetical protein
LKLPELLSFIPELLPRLLSRILIMGSSNGSDPLLATIDPLNLPVVVISNTSEDVGGTNPARAVLVVTYAAF